MAMEWFFRNSPFSENSKLDKCINDLVQFVVVVAQFYPWFKFSFLLLQTHYHVIIIHYHTRKQKKRKFEPRIKLNHNIVKDDKYANISNFVDDIEL